MSEIQFPEGDYYVTCYLRGGKKIRIGPGVSKRDAAVITAWLKKAWSELRAIALRSRAHKI